MSTTQRRPCRTHRQAITWAVGAVAGLGLSLAYGGCKSTQTAPPAVPQVSAIAAAGDDLEVLQRGRTVYLSSCTRCHAALPIADHSTGEWRQILPRMIRLSGLEQRRADDLTTYVLTSRSRLDDQAQPATR